MRGENDLRAALSSLERHAPDPAAVLRAVHEQDARGRAARGRAARQRGGSWPRWIVALAAAASVVAVVAGSLLGTGVLTSGKSPGQDKTAQLPGGMAPAGHPGWPSCLLPRAGLPAPWRQARQGSLDRPAGTTGRGHPGHGDWRGGGGRDAASGHGQGRGWRGVARQQAPESGWVRPAPAAGAASVPNSAMDMPSGSVIGLLHPGEMGASVGRCLTDAGHVVLWASQGRGPETAARARAAGLEDAGTTEEVAGRAEIILSICPPHVALDVAWAVQGFGGLFIDANAISPATAREVALMVEDSGATYVDGGIIGPPPAAAGSTRLYLSGPDAPTVCALFAGTPLDARVAGVGATAASTVKMAYAGWTKGTAALLLAVRAFARAEGVEETLLQEWAMSQPALADRCRGAAQSATAKGWRWVAEMEEIAASMTAAGLPDGFHQGAAEIFRRAPRATGSAATGDQALDVVLAALAPAWADDRLPAPE